MQYVYKMIQIPPTIQVQSKDVRGREAAEYLQNIVNNNAKDGWEFYRVDEIGVQENPGCLAALSGQKSQGFIYYVVTFRKEST